MHSKPEGKSGFGKHTPPGQQKPNKLRWLKGLALGLGLFVGAYFLFQNQIVDSQLRPVIERELAKAVNAPVSILSMRAGLHGNVVLNHVTLNIPGKPWETQIVVEKLSVNIELFNLIFHRKAIEQCFESIAFVQPRITLVKKEQTVLSSPAPMTAASVAVSGTTAPIPLIPVPKIIVSKGSFFIQAEKNPREILKDLNFTASTDNRATWGLLLQAHSPETKSLGEVRFDGNLRLEDLKVSGKVVLQQWPLASIQSVLKELAGWELQSGTIDAESPLVFQLGKGLWYDAKATLTQATLKSPPPTSITLSQISGRVFIRPTDITVPGEVRFQLGETLWRASGLIPLDNRPLAVKTTTDELFLSSIFTEILKAKELKVDGKGTATLTVAGFMGDPIIQASAELGPSHVGKWELDSLSAKAGYEKGTLQLSQSIGKLYDGDFRANGSLSLLDEKNGPVSLRAVLKNIESKKLATALGISGMNGRGDVDVVVSGTRDRPLVSASSQMVLDRTLRNSLFHYSVHSKLVMADRKMTLSAVIDEKAKLDAESVWKNDNWEAQFVLTTGKKSGRVAGRGIWPGTAEGQVDIQFGGKNIILREIPFLNDQFPDILGNVDLDSKVTGTPKNLQAKIHLSSEEITLKNLDPEPFELSLAWNPALDELDFETLTLGEIFSTSGKMGFKPEAPLDLKIQAKNFPIPKIAALVGWNNPPQPFEGLLTGNLHVAGKRKNPIVEGKDGIKISSLKMGDWTADQVEAVSSFEQDKLLIKRIKLTQGVNTLVASGIWDSRLQPGVMSLHIASRNFQLGKGPSLSGDFQWEAKTGDPFWRDWTGTFSSDSISLQDLNKKTYTFDDFLMTATSDNLLIKGRVKIGNAMAGSAVLDLASSPVKIQGMLKIEPILLSQATELTQFLPAALKASGKISGQVVLRDGTFEELPMSGKFTVSDGKIGNYSFERMEFSYSGNKPKVSLNFAVERAETRYLLSGTLESTKAFWDSESQINLTGTVQKEKLKNLLGLMLDTEKHVVTGQVNGNLAVSGPLNNPSVSFSVSGENLQYDANRVPSAELHFSKTGGKITLEKNRIVLPKGEINIEKGTAQLDPDDPTVALFDITGSTKDVPIQVINFTSRIHMTGRLALEEKESRPTFDGLLSIVESGHGEKNPGSFDLGIQVHKKIIDLKPLDGDKAQLVGKIDVSKDQKIIFQNLHLEHSQGSFAVDGTLDLNGNSQFVSDAKNIPIEALGKWFLPNFPLSGTGSYHLIFDGTLDSPVLTTSLSIANGKIGDFQFDFLNGELKSKGNVLSLGTKEVPFSLSRKGLFNFNVWGKAPIALTKTGWIKVHNKEMDINAEMEKGDFGIILLAGLGKKASGNMNFSAHVGGTVDNPNLTLDLDLNQCMVVPNMVAQSIDDINGRIKVRNNRLAVEDLNGRIGQGRVFISSPPIEESKMVLENFIPNYLDFRVQTVGEHGMWMSIPTIMKPGEWGEIYFYGASPKDPMLIRGALTEPHVIGTAFLESGHYTFPPDEVVDDKGEKIEYRQLAGVFFELKLAAGKNTWYSNEFNSNYLELKIDPGDEFMIEGKDSDRTPLEAGIKAHGSAGSKEGYLRYLGHEFKLQEASLYIPKGKSPHMQGRAVDRIRDAEVVSAGGIRKTDVDIWADFQGNFGNITFTFDSNPRFSTDPEKHQKILLSNIVFGRDMTGLSREELQTAYDQKVGQVALQAGKEFLDRLASSEATKLVRPLANAWGKVEVDIKSNIASNALNDSAAGPSTNSAGATQIVTDSTGNTISGATVPLVQIKMRKYLNPKLSVTTLLGANRDSLTDKVGLQGQVGVGYDFNQNLSAGVTTGQNDSGQQETKIGVGFRESLPDIMGPKKGDKERPRFERFDVYPIGIGKFQLIWITDKVTKSEVKVLDLEGKLIQAIPEKKTHDYRHQLIVENLDPEMAYTIQISVKDLNENESIKTQKISPNSN